MVYLPTCCYCRSAERAPPSGIAVCQHRRSSGSPAGTTLSSLQRSKASCFSCRRPRLLLGDRDRGGPRRARQVSHQLNSSQGSKSCCFSGSPRPRSPVGGPPHQAMICNQPKCGKESRATQLRHRYEVSISSWGSSLCSISGGSRLRTTARGPRLRRAAPSSPVRYYINHLVRQHLQDILV